MKPAFTFPVLLAACVQAPPPEPIAISKSLFTDNGSSWMALIEGNPGSLVDVEVTGSSGPSAPVQDFAMEGCIKAGGTFDPAAKLNYQDPGLYTFLKGCQL